MSTIADETPIIPEILAESVCREAGELIECLDTDPEAALCERAERHYAKRNLFSTRIRSLHGREILTAFMRHWLAGMLLKAGVPREQLPNSFVS